ncbi:glycoside hydrolase family 18 protein [Penicillium vulpinum]|uniref:glycoside hydrolase family 18 protein n=1 Tax=Penicillium vulpinum TaxID=29845 RepID=UPI00254982F2|nr:glycoside hydrolase family 18 protein [Penicillium vulpinum]KAJ5958894.1 glycoside hydrolase family 18 protein [Penicillium vulpinum]
MAFVVGTTSDFCGKKTVKKPSCSGSSADGRSIGYYEGWSINRVCDAMTPEAIPVGAYTHLNYGFAYINPDTFAVAPMSESDLGLYSRFTNLKESNAGLETWISIGGWSMNDADQPTATTFSDLATSSSAQKAFFKSLLSFMTTYGFDGVDIDWEYPVASDRSGKASDFENYPSFLKNLKAALGSTGHDYGLSITVPSSYWYLQNFDIISIEKYIDWFNVMTYDLHGTWDSTDPYIGSYVYAHTNLTEIDQTMDLFWRNSITPSKINLGLGFYGRSFTLSDPSCTKAGCPFSSGGNPGNCSASSGTLMDSEITAVIAAGGTTSVLDKDAAVNILTWDTDQWVSYDDETTIQMKKKYANDICLGGTMVWAVSTDDNTGAASQNLMELNSVISKSLFWGETPKVSPLSQFIWGGCDEDCPSGTTPAATGKGKSASNVAIYSGCASGKKRNYCCPTDDVPTCHWQGSAPLCRSHSCASDEAQIATDQSAGGHGCWFNHKSLCCSTSSSDAAVGQCKWSGSAPGCASGQNHASCASGFPEYLTDSVNGQGGESTDPTNDPPNFCSAADTAYVYSDELDSDENSADFVELYWYEDDCFTLPNTGDPDLMKRWFALYDKVGEGEIWKRSVAPPPGKRNEGFPKICIDEDCFNVPKSEHQDFEELLWSVGNFTHGSYVEVVGEVVPRASRTAKICQNKKQISKFSAKPYSPVSILSTSRQFFGVVKSGAKSALCNGLPVVLGKRALGTNYVVEHVTELQTPAQFATSMLSGKLPSGAAAPGAASNYDWTQVFSQNGYFFQTWNQLGISQPSGLSGSTPAESVAIALGSSKDINNLQILEAPTNGLKAAAWQLFKNIISDDRFSKQSAVGRIDFINRLYDTLPGYLNHADVQDSLEYGYNAIKTAMEALDQAAKSNANVSPITASSFSLAWKTYASDFFEQMEGNLQVFVKTRITEVLPYWKSSEAIKLYTKASAAAITKVLNEKLADLTTDVVIDSSFVK